MSALRQKQPFISSNCDRSIFANLPTSYSNRISISLAPGIGLGRRFTQT
jgi:hypothetical protein